MLWIKQKLLNNNNIEEVMTQVVDPAAITTFETTPQQQEKHYTIEEDYFLYRGRGQGVHRSEIKQFSEIIEEKRNASSSFIIIYNNVHYLKEAVVFDCITDFYFKPTVESDDSLPFLQFLTLRQECKPWKRMIDEKYGRNFILSKLQHRVTYRYCPLNAEFYVFRIPIQLTIVACWWPSWLADRMILSGKVQAYALGLSCFLTYMIVGGNPMLVPVGVLGYIVDLAIESILSQRDPIQEISLPKRVLNRYDRIEYNIMNEISRVDKCEIISSIQDDERYNNHSCFYIVQVTLCIDGKMLGYRIMKKYTQFRELYDAMCKCIKKDVLEVTRNHDDGDVLERIEFPAKRWSFFSNSDQVIEERRLIFQKMLNLIVDESNLFNSSDIYSFFHDRYQQRYALLRNTDASTN